MVDVLLQIMLLIRYFRINRDENCDYNIKSKGSLKIKTIRGSQLGQKPIHTAQKRLRKISCDIPFIIFENMRMEHCTFFC
jgi:hypothetical protein